MPPQESAAAWAAARDDAYPPVVAAGVGDLRKVVAAATADGFDLALVDTAPHNSPATAAVARVADLAVLPVRPSAFDLAAVPKTVDVVRATKRRAVFVLNGCPTSGTEVDEAREALAGYGVETWAGQVGERKIFKRAISRGRTVIELEPAGKGAEEIRALWAYLAGQLAG